MKLYTKTKGKYIQVLPELEMAKMMKIEKTTLKAYRLRKQTKKKWFKLYGSIYYIYESITK